MNAYENKMMDAALTYAELGFAVFPLVPGGKEPLGNLAPNGFKNATKDPAEINRIWESEPNANIGIACGAASGGLCVVDVDTHNEDGKKSLRSWLEERGATLPETVTARTGGDGLHYYFRSDEACKSRTGILPGIDVKAEGGYIVAPPSVHPSGTPYAWEEGRSQLEAQIAEVDDVVRALVEYRAPKGKDEGGDAEDGKVHEGGRNDALASHLGHLRHFGYGLEELIKEALTYNASTLVPPLDEAEAVGVALSISKYQAPKGRVQADQELLDRLAELRPEDGGRYGSTDQGRGYLFADVFKDKARYCPERKSWYVYDGARWKHDAGALEAGELVKELANALALHRCFLNASEAELNRLDAEWSKWQKRSVRDTILKDAAGVHPLALAEFDANPYLLNVENGTLDLEAGELKLHSPADLITKLAPVSYRPDAAYPRWGQFVSEITDGDEEEALFLQRCFGYALSGSTHHEAMFLLYGPTSRNGKSTLVEAVLNVLGDYGAVTNPEMLSTARSTAGGMKATEDLARLDGVRFASVPELPRGMRLNSATVKHWTGSDSVNARFLNENSFDYKPQFKLFVNTNHLPTATDATLFKSGRVVVVPFTRHFTEAERDPELKRKFRSEEAMSAILNWLLEGWLSLRAEGLALPPSVASATGKYAEENDVVKRFAEERLEKDAGNAVATSELLKAFNEWARSNGVEQSNANSFKGELERAGFQVMRRRPTSITNPVNCVLGFKIKQPNSLHP
ncbi:phage/plasmid primase, P4 family [Arabiibacter massiliensis]|uniref:phage/plasmid primase, P4 family n=1 Tax=Arabiibacter massiliensis TaxID=1870985 RepID=UPI0009B93EEA|nr:phage/plasmid primase, P4 family [Arabiibacter massiliensis]